MKNRIQNLQRKLTLDLTEGFLVFDAYNITYLSQFTGHAATVLVTGKKHYLITDYRYFEQAKDQVSEFTVICRDRTEQSLGNLINQLLQEQGIEKLFYECDHISVGQWQTLSVEIALKNTSGISRVVEDLRYYKDTVEINNIEQAAKIADQALVNMLPLVTHGVRERDLAIELEYQMSLLGSEEQSFATILSFAERSALPHGIPGNKKLKKGDLILIDFGAVVNGYRSDMTRTYVFGKADIQQKEIYNTVRLAQQSAIDAISEGVTGEYLYRKSEAVIKGSAYAEFMGEGLGHGVGLALHEFPFMGKNCQLKIKKGCVVTIEPGIYIPEWGGVRIEDDVVLTDEGLRVLTQAPKDQFEL